ncbi:MAG: DegV family EDD domain-containing protein [Lachnospiraceae bacterium]|nr:DegV family EDD domain-containing protein [Lachnospiraceae bacterium]
MDKKDFRVVYPTEGAQLLILIAYTITAGSLFSQIMLMGWNKLSIPALACATVFSWYTYLLQKYDGEHRVWMYTVFMMFCFFYYGIHQTKLDQLSISIIIIIIVFFFTRICGLIWMAVFTYFFTIFFDIVGATDRWQEEFSTSRVELAFQFGMVLLAGIIMHLFISERNAEQKIFQDIIGITDEQRNLAREQVRIVSRELGKLAMDTRGELLLLQEEMKKEFPDEELPKEIDTLTAMVWKLEAELSDLKDYSNILLEKIEIKNEVYETMDIIASLKSERQKIGRELDIDLVIDIDPTIPKAMVGDRNAVLKIMKHLLENGIRYTEEGGVQLKVFTHSHEDEYNLCIEVNDTGIGMEQTDLEHIIDQIDERKMAGYHPGGLGLGLFLVSGFIKEIGGFFSIESEWGKGTSVRVSIPQRVSDAAPCISFDKKGDICMVYEEKEYKNAKLNGFYEDLFRHFSDGMGIPAYSIKNRDELDELTRAYKKVCLIINDYHYREKPDYYESLKDVYLAVLAGADFSLPEGSVGHIFRRPIGTMELHKLFETVMKTVDMRRRSDERKHDISQKAVIHAETLNEREIRKNGGKNIMIVTDSMSDLSPETSRDRGIPVIPFRIYSEHASFLDGVEMSQECALNLIKENPGIHSMAPTEDDFREFFEENLKYAKEIIYVSTAKKVSVAYDRAKNVASKMEHVTVVNSGQVSGGVSIMTVMADEMVKKGKTKDEVVAFLEELRPKVKTTFFIDNLDHLAHVGRVSKTVALLSRTFMLHPMVAMKHDMMTVAGVHIGKLINAKEAYIRKIIRNGDRIDHSRVFIGSIGIDRQEIIGLKQQLMTEGNFDYVIVRRASAAISINCGVGTFGIIYVEK